MTQLEAVVEDFLVNRNDHGTWDVFLNVIVEAPEYRLSYYRHTGVDVEFAPRGYIKFMQEYFRPLEQIGLTDAGKYARLYSNLMRRLDKTPIPHPKALARHNDEITQQLKGKKVIAEVTPWPLSSGQSYSVVILPYKS